MFSIIAAIGTQGQLGINGVLPWPKLKEDMRWFQAITMARNPYVVAKEWLFTNRDMGPQIYTNTPPCNAVIMGRRTWESLPGPLVGRQNYVLTSKIPTGEVLAKAVFPRTINDALACANWTAAPNIFIIGGAQVYAEALRHPGCERLYITQVEYGVGADTYWPGLTPLWLQGEMWSEDGERILWQRKCVSQWIDEPDRPPYRFGIWERT